MSVTKSKSEPVKKGQRLSREEWLSYALIALEKEGGGVLTIDALSRRLGVSRGSFYWHFKGRADFICELVEYWSMTSSKSIFSEVAQTGLDAKQRLLLLMKGIVSQRLARYDFVIHSWASKDSKAKKMLEQVYDYRLDYVRSLFAEIGFTDDELEMRTRTLVIYYSMEPSFLSQISHEEQMEQVKSRHALLTRFE